MHIISSIQLILFKLCKRSVCLEWKRTGGRKMTNPITRTLPTQSFAVGTFSHISYSLLYGVFSLCVDLCPWVFSTISLSLLPAKTYFLLAETGETKYVCIGLLYPVPASWLDSWNFICIHIELFKTQDTSYFILFWGLTPTPATRLRGMGRCTSILIPQPSSPPLPKETVYLSIPTPCSD